MTREPRIPGLRRVFRLGATRAVERDVDDEIRFHLESRVEALLAAGHAPAAARAIAEREFGDVAAARGELADVDRRLRARQARAGWLEALAHDVRHALRGLRRQPLYALAALVTLAVGIGATTAVFSVVRGVLLRPLPYPEADRVVRVASVHAGEQIAVSPPDFVDWRARGRSFAGLAASYESTVSLTGAGQPERFLQARVTADLFDVLGVRPLLGRTFVAGEDEPGAPQVAVLGERLWRTRFGADSGILGRVLVLDDVPTTVVGVVPAAVRYPSAVDLWLPARLAPDDLAPSSRGARWLTVVGRLAPGATLAGARAEMHAVARQLAAEDPKHDAGWDAAVVPLREQLVGDVRTPLLVLLGAVGFVLLIAAANVASLSLARATARRAELAVRVALGAGRGRLVRQLVTESLCLAALGALGGVGLALLGTRLLVRLAPPGLPRLPDVRVDAGVLVFAAVVALATGVAVGLATALQAGAADPSARLREGGRGAAGQAAHLRWRGGLVVTEIALAIVLLVGAGLLLRSFGRLTDVDPGFRPEGVATFSVTLSARYDTPERQRLFAAALLERVRALPGVDAAGSSFNLPFTDASFRLTFTIDDRPLADGAEEPRAQFRMVSPGYFAAMGIPLRRGRAFTDADRDGAPYVVVLSEETARRFFPGEDPIGRRIETGWSDGGAELGGVVVGVVGDVRQFGLADDLTPHVYVPYAQWPIDELTVVAHTRGDPARLVAEARDVVQALDPALPVYDATTLPRLLGASLGAQRFYLALLAIFAGVAVVLAAVGIYGLVAYGVAARAREIGVRVALGATPGGVVRLLVRQGLRLAAVGIVAGLAGAATLARLLRGLLFEVGTADPATYAAVAAAVAALVVAATWLPARRAARIDPTEALREG
ncbi:MAG TPA: ABC transporter permease [Gemmatimonadaceae bacterium]|nr:ABC transporter permease [Gemmatimonadaceae bacterium]